MLHFAFLDQLFDCPSHIFDRDIRVNAVLVKQVNTVGTQAFQRFFSNLTNALRPTVEPFADVALH
jgi:hypothetical protein